MTLDYFALSCVPPLLLFLPGALLLHLIFRTRGRSLPSLDLLLTGSTIWNFVFVVPSLLLGLFTSSVPNYFTAFVALSLGLIVLYVLFMARGLVKESTVLRRGRPKPGLQGVLYTLYPLLLGGFVALLTVYTSVIQNIDAVVYYLPMAEAILRTGGLGYSPLYLSKIAMTYPPTLPLMYSFTIHLTGGIHVRLIPLTYFLLTNLAILQLASKISNNKGAGLIAAVAYSSMLATQMVVAVEGLSLDLGYVFYTTVALYAILKGQEENSMFWYGIAGMACGLAAVTKELGVVTLLLGLSTLLLRSTIRRRRTLFLATSTLFFTGLGALETSTLLGLKAFSLPITNPVLYLHMLFLLMVMFILLWYLSKDSTPNTDRPTKISHVSVFLALSLLPCIFYVNNLLSLGVVTPGWAPSLVSAMVEAGIPRSPPSFQPPDPSSPLAIPYILHLEWYLVFFTSPLGLLYLIPGIAGLVSLVLKLERRPERPAQILLIWFVTLLAMWSFLSSILSWQSYEPLLWPSYQYRRLYYFAPILSVMVGEGVKGISQRLGLKGNVMLRFVTFNTLALAYVWTFRQSLELFVLRWIFETNLGDVALSASLFALTLLLPSLVKGFKNLGGGLFKGLHKATSLIPAILLAVNLLLPTYLIALGASWIGQEGWDPAYYNRLESCLPSLGRGPWLEVIEYYNQHVQDDYVTVMFFSYIFAYFTDKPVIDPYRIFSYEPLIPLLKIGDEETLIQTLLEMKVRYFLIPKPTVPEIYELYGKFTEKYPLFRMVIQHPAFRQIKEFSLYYMYRLEEM